MEYRPFKANQAFCTRAGRIALLTEIADMAAEEAARPLVGPVPKTVTTAGKGKSLFGYFRWASRST